MLYWQIAHGLSALFRLVVLLLGVNEFFASKEFLLLFLVVSNYLNLVLIIWMIHPFIDPQMVLYSISLLSGQRLGIVCIKFSTSH